MQSPKTYKQQLFCACCRESLKLFFVISSKHIYCLHLKKRVMKQSIVKIAHAISKNLQIAAVLCLLQTVFKSRFFVISPERIYCPHLKKGVMEPSIVKIAHAISKNPQIAAVLCLLQRVFKAVFPHFVQAHLLSALKKKSNEAVDCQNCTSNLQKPTNSSSFVPAVNSF